jgi:hypothetical protein
MRIGLSHFSQGGSTEFRREFRTSPGIHGGLSPGLSPTALQLKSCWIYIQ